MGDKDGNGHGYSHEHWGGGWVGSAWLFPRGDGSRKDNGDDGDGKGCGLEPDFAWHTEGAGSADPD